MKGKAAIIVLALLLVSCRPPDILAPTKIVATKVVIPTLAPSNTSTPQWIPTFTPSSSVWQIWFKGYSCEGMELCGEVGEGQHPKSSYFSINSDGADLKPLQIQAFPTPKFPENAPPLPDGFATVPQISPDQSKLTYAAKDGESYHLYIVDIPSGEATSLYQTEKIPDHLFWIGTACWARDGKTIDFILHSRIGRDNQPPVLYRINKDGSNLQALFSFPGLENTWFGSCSPNGKELVLSIPGNTNSIENGLYVINRISGHSKQILSNFFVSVVRTP